MKRAISLSVTLTLTIAGMALSQEPKRPDTEQAQKRQQAAFGQFFTLRGIDFTQAQQAQVEELRKKYTPQLIEIQKKYGSILTDEQRRAQGEAFRAAREAGKQDAELRKAVEAAVRLTDEQKEKQAKIQQERADLLGTIQKELRALLTDEQRKQLRPQTETRGPAQPPTHPDVKYGPYARNVMDVWLAKSDKPTPILVSIHGGGFSGGNKSVNLGLLEECLKSGISVVAITYRLSNEAKAPAPFLDSARAIQFIRSKAKEWNLDASRIAATGGSAGAGISLWLGFHNDLADPKSDDPVLRQSTRLTCMFVFDGQTSYDPRFIRDLFPGANTYKIGALAQLFDMDPNKLDQLPKEKYKLFEECSPITHLTKEDAPAMLIYGRTMDSGADIHHPRFGKALKEKMDALGIECKVQAGRQQGGESPMDFMKRHFGMK